ncbi:MULTISPECIES: TonB-dependent receptor domain-containing protein [unclassified Tenacibaculum]|uniref:TonB-dependent receptor domain-containing protein n=1 Tax=unclassified Tenacibaculum TaxID=2635139 RepID=UPI001F3429A4|nr:MULTISPECIES: TonB-dependent receptor [unclassified Tenacibaculum]MCF2874125.1 TonB-dependent receptor family protein [Tenacibaculum sp. Cn5-1]MCF2934706.1 TonB-dependent receptor family protein [Tenacibaculum sp. Cn5-34]MCG7510916.1 TonB-dependent receptor family protein [Tenacibaculum sp. Cn5-46]
MRNILLILLTVFSVNLFAQMPKGKLPKPGSVSGKVIDQTTKEPLPYVNIIIKDTANKILTGGITNDNGTFSVNNIPEGKNIVEVQFIGYKTVSKPILINSKRRKINLGTIPLTEDSTTLDEVEVRAETSSVTQKVDRKVINVGKDLTSAGATASELLNNVQSVSVDSQTGNISLRGNENVRVLVDGKPTNIPASQLLKQIPSTSIKSVELITNPSAKYNPEGMSGIINIVLNKNANMGFNGSVNTGLEVGHYVRYNASTNMNYKTGKVNFFGNYGFNGGDRYNFGYVNRPTVNNQDFIFKNDNQSHLLKFGADIYLNEKNTLSFYTTQNWFDSKATGRAQIFDGAGNLVVHAPNSQTSDSHNQTYNINYKLDFEKKGHNIEFEATYSKNESPNLLENDFLLGSQQDYINNINNDRNNTLINLDYTNPVSKNGKLELGLEYRVNKTDNTNLTTQVGFNNSSFTYDRDIFSGYVNYGHKFGKVTMQLGARLENYEIKGVFNQVTQPTATVTDKIFTVYPSAFFTFNPSEKNQFQLSYSRRVDRPGIGQVNPIREWSTPLITSQGNPNLVPQFTNSLEINYTRRIKGGSLTFGTFYRNINDVINRATYEDSADPNRQILTYANFDDTNAYGVEFSTNYRIAKWWRANASMDFYSQKQFGTNDVSNPAAPRREVTTEIFNARISNSFTISKKLRLQLFAMYRGPRQDIQWDVDPMTMVNLGANYSVLKGKGNFTFRVNDIFNTMRFKFDSTNPFVQNGRFKWESRTTYIGFNYRFGGGKNKAKRRRNRDNNEKSGGGGFM